MIHRVLGTRWVQIAAAVLILVIAVLGWLAYSAVKAKGDLESARDEASRARSLILDGDAGGAQAAAKSAAGAAGSASSRTHGFLWNAVAAIPWLGSPLKSTQEMSDAVADFASDVLVPSAKVADVLDPDQLRSGDVIRTDPLLRAQPVLAEVSAKSTAIAAQVKAIGPSWLGPVSDAKAQLQKQIDDATSTVSATNAAAQLIPSMLGGQGKRSYFMSFQTPSEARGTGGLMGGFAVMDADKGKVVIPTLGANSVLRSPSAPQIDLGPEYDLLYKYFRPYTDIRNANLSANFPDAAKIWIANWKAQTNQQLDGAIAVDPVALSYLLKVSGPVTLPNGEKITADNVIPITLSTSYVRFAQNNDARKLYLQVIAKAVVDKLVTGSGNTHALLDALGRGVSERRIMVYSTHPEEQRILQTTALAHQISDTGAPYLQMSIGNAAGNKVDYYLRREISYRAGDCSGDRRESTTTVKLTNTLDNLSLPDYVIGSTGTRLSVPKGTNLANVEFLTTKGATYKSITVDGQPALSTQQALHGRPYFSTRVVIPPGQTVTITLTLDEPVVAGKAEVPVQPLVDNPKVDVDVPTCG